MNKKFINFYIKVCYETSLLSKAERLKVGSVIVKENSIIGFGYNGLPTGWDDSKTEINKGDSLITNPAVIHSEMNSILKVAKSTESCNGAIMFSTHSPCLECSKAIYMSGIIEFYYGEEYRDSGGLDFLKKCGVRVEKI